MYENEIKEIVGRGNDREIYLGLLNLVKQAADQKGRL